MQKTRSWSPLLYPSAPLSSCRRLSGVPIWWAMQSNRLRSMGARFWVVGTMWSSGGDGWARDPGIQLSAGSRAVLVPFSTAAQSHQKRCGAVNAAGGGHPVHGSRHIQQMIHSRAGLPNSASLTIRAKLRTSYRTSATWGICSWRRCATKHIPFCGNPKFVCFSADGSGQDL